MDKYEIERVNKAARKYSEWVKGLCGKTMCLTDQILDSIENAYATGMLHALNGLWREVTPMDYPPSYTDVLCLGETGDVAILQVIYDAKHGNAPVWHPRVKCKITHWMPIPEKPKTENK